MNTKEKILQSALKLFVEKGFSVTTSAITKDAELSTGILFHYFSTKNELIIYLYGKIVLEYYKVLVEEAKNVAENEPEKYRSIIRKSWDAIINWGLDNWRKFQFLQLLESSLLADQVKLEDNKDIQQLNDRLIEMTRLGIEYGYLRDIPVIFNIAIMKALIATITKYIHENPHYRYDEDFIEQSWKICWNGVIK